MVLSINFTRFLRRTFSHKQGTYKKKKERKKEWKERTGGYKKKKKRNRPIIERKKSTSSSTACWCSLSLQCCLGAHTGLLNKGRWRQVPPPPSRGDIFPGSANNHTTVCFLSAAQLRGHSAQPASAALKVGRNSRAISPGLSTSDISPPLRGTL